MRDLQSPPKQPVYRDQLITAGDLESLKADLLSGIRNILIDLKGQTTKKWLESYEVKKLLKLSNVTLQTRRSNGALPYTWIGGTLYYNNDDIDKLLDERQSQNLSKQLTKQKQ